MKGLSKEISLRSLPSQRERTKPNGLEMTKIALSPRPAQYSPDYLPSELERNHRAAL